LTVYGTVDGAGINYTPFGVDANKTCNMLKASFAFGIISVLTFAWSAVGAYLMHRHMKGEVVVEKTTTVRRRSHDSRRGHSQRRSSRDSRRNYYV
jgi:hypothetical protein